ncbi:adenylosuccinate synthase [Sphingobacterium psychroaquaticum]|uniref:Adenylosuccinate synthetase n=1 Tax=Sphingobacterium psychroaquaticum TaxID=561061 RepID=A0A1X7JPG8_9SPHI|nr:adenylosuccinate synthase [Sphingobacterium psychroaquaticum]SMG30096.1 Adenylosuccinate synthetase [Sphingobacterium psychroaquaticum]
MKTGKMDILVGLQWGDEGKGKFIDRICSAYDIVARFNGGANAGHTIFWQSHKVTLKLLPSGVFYPHIKNVIGTGVVVNPTQLRREIDDLSAISAGLSITNNLFISKKAHLVLPTYAYRDAYMEASADFQTIGTTKNGIGQAYANKMLRQGFRVGDIYMDTFEEKVKTAIVREYEELRAKEQEMIDLQEMIHVFFTDIEYLKKLHIIDTELYLNTALYSGERVLAEGAQATMLDIDHGTYPYVTSSSTIASAACVSLGVSPTKVGDVYGVFKAYTTRVGDGAFPSEIADELSEKLRQKGNEFGSNTGRPRRIGWLDLPALKYAVMLNGVTQLIMTKADVLNEMETVDICTQYIVNDVISDYASLDYSFQLAKPVWTRLMGWTGDFTQVESEMDLPDGLMAYIRFLNTALEVPVRYLSIGPQRDAIVELTEDL